MCAGPGTYRRKGTQTLHLPSLPNAPGNPAGLAGCGSVSPSRHEPCNLKTHGRGGERYRGGTQNANRQTQAVCQSASRWLRKEGRGNDGLWKAKKDGFPQPLEIAAAIPTFPPPRLLLLLVPEINPEGAFLSPCSQASPGSFFDLKRLSF